MAWACSEDQPIEQHADGGQVLLDRRHGYALAQLLERATALRFAGSLLFSRWSIM
jgi:hypothetical protein